MGSTGRRTPIFGPEPWTEHASAGVVALGSLVPRGVRGGLRRRLGCAGRAVGAAARAPGRGGKLSHLDDLVGRFAAVDTAIESR